MYLFHISVNFTRKQKRALKKAYDQGLASYSRATDKLKVQQVAANNGISEQPLKVNKVCTVK